MSDRESGDGTPRLLHINLHLGAGITQSLDAGWCDALQPAERQPSERLAGRQFHQPLVGDLRATEFELLQRGHRGHGPQRLVGNGQLLRGHAVVDELVYTVGRDRDAVLAELDAPLGARMRELLGVGIRDDEHTLAELLKSAGYRIGPSEIENCLVKHPAVANAAVVPKPDPERGALVKAYVVLAPGHTASEALIADLQAHVRSLLAPYEYPKEIEFIDALPMTTTGKVQRRVLRLQEQERARQR